MNDGTTGSPPHTRGTLVFYISSIALIRITPAYTGNTTRLQASSCFCQDHPRIHGEHCLMNAIATRRRGSPPHTRGTPHSITFALPGPRITPAYTGNTFRMEDQDTKPQDHPRIHGEHLVYLNRTLNRLGSPPHTRGTHKFLNASITGWRITPAYTGNTRIKQSGYTPI